MSFLDELRYRNREVDLMEMILTYLLRWVTQLSFYHAKRREVVKFREGVEIWRRGTEAGLKSIGRGSMEFDKCEQREATGLTGSECFSDDFQKIDGFVLLKSAAVQNIPLTEFLSRARRVQRILRNGRTSSRAEISVVFV